MTKILTGLLVAALFTTLVIAQEPPEYSVLSQPTYANKFNLTDQQRAEVARILDRRITELVNSPATDREKILAASNSELAQVLTEEQRRAFASSARGGKLQFNFKEQKWSTVLEWVAKQAGQSLVMDAEPTGLFTYTDTNEYTPTEAIDLLNSVLLSKDFTLIRREKMLVLADTSEGIPYDIVPQITVEELAQRGRFEIVTVAFPLGTRPVDTVVEQVTPLVGPHGQVTPLAAAKKLLVTEAAGKLQGINVLIASIPEATKPKPPPIVKPPEPVFTTYPAPGLDPVATTETLHELFPTAQLRFDPNADEVHANAIPAIQTAIKSSIEKMVANISGDKQPRLRAYPVEPNQVEEILRQLTLVHPETNVISDPTNSRILVVANEAEQTNLQQTLEAIGIQATDNPDEMTQVRIYAVDKQMVDPLTTLLKEVIPRALVLSNAARIVVRGEESEQTLAKSTIDQFLANAETQPTLIFYPLKKPLDDSILTVLSELSPLATISQLADQDQLSVVATPEDHKTISKTLSDIEQLRPTEQKRTLRIFPVSKDQKARLTAITDQLDSITGTMKIVTDASPDEIATWGSEEQHVAFEQLLTQLKSEEKSVPLSAKQLPVAVQDGSTLLAMMKKRFPDVSMIMNDSEDTISIWIDDETFDAVRLQFEEFVASMPKKQESKLETYGIENADPTMLVSTLQTLAPSATISVDDGGKRLIVMASSKEHQQIAEAIAKLVNADRANSTVLISYPLEKADAEAVVALLSGIQTSWNIVADPRSNRVLASAPLREQPRIEAMIQQLDAEPEKKNETVVESYPFRTLDPSTVVSMLQSLFPEMQLTVDAANQQIVASGTGLEQQRLLAAIERVDGRGPTIKTHVAAYPLGDATAEEVTNVLTQLVPTAVISASPEANRVFVWADEDSHQAIAEAIREFTRTSADETRILKIYPITQPLAESVIAILQPMAETASLSLDSSAGSLIVWATQSQQQTIKEALEALATNQPTNSDHTLKLHRSTPDTILIANPILAELFPLVRIIESASPDQLVVWGDEADQAKITAVLTELEQEISQAGSNQEARLYSLEDLTASTIETVLDSQVPRARLLEITDRNILLLANADEHQQIGDILVKLQTTMGEQKKPVLRKHAIRSDLISKFTEFLTTALPAAKLLTTESNDSVSVFAVEADQAEIEKWIKQFESEIEQPAQRSVRVYPIDADKIEVTSLLNAIDSETSEGLTLQPNTETNSLVARGTELQHQKLQAAIEAIVVQLPDSEKLTTKVYRFFDGSPTNAATALTSMLPEATIAADDDASVLVVSATDKQHDVIAEVVDQIEATEPEANQITRIYRFDRATAETVRDAFAMLAPKAITSFDAGSNVVIATATAQDHIIFNDAASQLEGRPKGSLVRVYPIDRRKMATKTLMAALDDPLKNSLVIQENEISNSLIARGSEIDHEQLRQAIDAIVDELPEASNVLTSKVYALKLADPKVVAKALASLTPEATLASDGNSGSLIVTANDEDHQQIAAVIDQLDVPTGQSPIMRAYPIRNGDAGAIYRSISAAFSGNSEFVISFQDITKTVYLIATPRNHAVFEELLKSLDATPPNRAPRQAKVYPLTNLRAADAAATATAITDGLFPKPDIRPNPLTNSLVIVASETQHALIKESLEKLDGSEKQLEVFQLLSADPVVVESAISELFRDLPNGTAPSISTDYGTSKLFVRSTEAQLVQIRQLLQKLGEPTSESKMADGLGNQRRITFPGGTRDVVEQLQIVWPRIRRNKIQVITPANNIIQSLYPDKNQQGGRGDVDETTPNDRASSGPEDDTTLLQRSKYRATHLVVAQETTRSATPKEKTAAETTEQKEIETGVALQEPDDEELAPILVFPSGDNITIRSDDPDALNVLESLLRAIANSQNGLAVNSNFSVFLLRNSGAKDIESLFEDLIDDLPFQRGGLSEIVVVADERLNALIVHGTIRSRELVGELLEVLDKQDVRDPLQAFRPEMLRLQNTSAERILAILKNVYKTQLTSGGGRKPVAIPEGVDSTVASVLQQINAKTAGPLLTLDIDQNSNALIMRAPPELREEIAGFVDELDKPTTTESNRRVRVIRLKQSNSDLMQSVLEQFINNNK
ncbi:MAG: secretin N-terminal domain-containing protein [Rubripirellula sp.]